MTKSNTVRSLGVGLLALALVCNCGVWGTIIRRSDVIRAAGRFMLERGRALAPPTAPDELLLESPAFPPAWSPDNTVAGRRAGLLFCCEYDAAERWFVASNGPRLENVDDSARAVHSVARYVSVWHARWEYRGLAQYSFRHSENLITPWQVPSGWNDTSLHADEHRVGCAVETGVLGEIERCKLVARYDQYVTTFWVLFDGTGLNDQALAQIVQEIDTKFVGMNSAGQHDN